MKDKKPWQQPKLQRKKKKNDREMLGEKDHKKQQKNLTMQLEVINKKILTTQSA